MELNPVLEDAFTIPIKDGYARLLLKLQFIQCQIENSAPDFINVEEDEVSLSISPAPGIKKSAPTFKRAFPVDLDVCDPSGNKATFKFNQESVWFDIEINLVKEIWFSDFTFNLEGKNNRYLTYYISSLNHQIEWLQPELKTGQIQSMGVYSKKFKPYKVFIKENFSTKEVLRCADMIGRSAKKIDLRTGGAYVKFNTDGGRLEPLIIGISEKLGYIVEPLDKDTILAMEDDGKNVSHAIYLQKL